MSLKNLHFKRTLKLCSAKYLIILLTWNPKIQRFFQILKPVGNFHLQCWYLKLLALLSCNNISTLWFFVLMMIQVEVSQKPLVVVPTRQFYLQYSNTTAWLCPIKSDPKEGLGVAQTVSHYRVHLVVNQHLNS